MPISKCLSVIERLSDQDQAALLERTERLEATGMPANKAALQAAIDMMAELQKQAAASVRRSASRDQTDTPEFKAWFKDSKVVDAEGKPLVVYHGTTADFNEFDLDRAIHFERDKGKAFFYGQPGPASNYAEGMSDYVGGSANVMPVYLSLQKPHVVSVNGGAAGWWDASGGRIEREAPNGTDGFIVNGVDEDGNVETMYVALRPNQIKSAIGNSGAFDPADGDITRSADRSDMLGDPPEAEQSVVQAGIEGKSLVDAVRFVAEKAPNQAHRLVAEQVATRLEELQGAGVNFDLRLARVGDSVPRALIGSRGITHWKGGEFTSVWLNASDVKGKSGMSFETVLHEALHAATMASIQIGNMRTAAGTDLGRDVADLYEVSNTIVRHLNKRFIDAADGKTKLTAFERGIYERATNAFRDPHEVVSWALTNSDAQTYLEGIKYRGAQSLWDAFVGAVRVALGLRARNDTVLSEVLRVSGRIMRAPVGDLKALGDSVGVQMQRSVVRIDDELERKIVDRFNAEGPERKVGSIEDVEESVDITAKSKAFSVMAEAEGYKVAHPGDKYLRLTKPSGDWTISLQARISDHSNVNRGVHFQESEINIAPDDGYPRDSFESALWKLRNATVNDDGDTLIDGKEPLRFSVERDDLGFYSALARGIEGMATKAAAAGAWKAQIKGLVNKGAVKQDEITWSGVEDWLDLQTGKVSKDDLLAYLQQGGVKVQEAVLGDVGDELPAGWRVEEEEEDPGLWSVRDAQGVMVGQAWGRAEAIRDAGVRDSRSTSDTRYGDYTLSGGENYREVLLTLPYSASTIDIDGWTAKVRRERSPITGNPEYEVFDARGQSMGVSYSEVNERDAIESVARARVRSQGERDNYKSSHWEQPNVLAHIRVNDRADTDGRRVLFVEEIQSDWGQEGKKKGFDTGPVDSSITMARDGAGFVVSRDGQAFWAGMSERRANEVLAAERAKAKKVPGVPSAPFVTKTEGWLNLALKRVVAMAVDGGYDAVAFVNGQQSADRYDLSKQVSDITYRKTGDDSYYIVVGGPNGGIHSGEHSASELEDYVGKELAQKIVDRADGDMKELSGLDLKVGGEGMKAFYDKIVPNAVKALLKKVGGDGLREVNIGESNGGRYVVRMPDGSLLGERSAAGVAMFDTRSAAARSARSNDRANGPGHSVEAAPKEGGVQQGFDITDAMRKKVATEGMPLFSRDRDPLDASMPITSYDQVQPVVGPVEKPKRTPKPRDTEAPEGRYWARTLVSTETKRELGAARITTPLELAAATRYLARGAVERFDAVVTDKGGKPLAVVGSLKGALAMAGVHAEVIAAEAVRVPGAARIWFSHNHPSGSPNLSAADERLNRQLVNVFRGSGIEPMGLAAIGSDRFAFINAEDEVTIRDIQPATGSARVPVYERELGDREQMPGIGKPQDSIQAARDLYKGDNPGVLLLDSAHVPSAYIPIDADVAGKMRGTGGLRTVMRAVSEANAGAAIIVHGGEYDARLPDGQAITVGQNLGAALRLINVKVLDNIDAKRLRSAAQHGDDLAVGPLFSRQRDLDRFALAGGYTLGDLMKSSKKLSWWDKTVGSMFNLAEKQPEFKRVYDGVQDFIGDISKYAARASDRAPTILPKLEALRDIARRPLSVDDTQALAGPVFEGTLLYTRDEDGNAVRTDDVGAAGVVWRDQELRDRYKLNDKQIGLYRETRRTINKSLTDLSITDMLRYVGKDAESVREDVLAATTADHAAQILVQELEQLAEDSPGRRAALEDAIRGVKEKAHMTHGLIAKGYAPLSRFGDYTVYVTRDDGKEQVFFGMYETEREANRAARAWRAAEPDAQVTTGTMSKESYKLFKGVTPETLALFGESLGLEEGATDRESQVFQAYLRAAKTNRSAMKRMIERKGVSGYSEDVGRVLAGFVYSNARQASTNLHAGAISKAAADIQSGDLKDQAIRLVEYVQNPAEEAQALRGLLFANYIGGSIASALVNLTQTATTTWPVLSQHYGIAKSAAALNDAVRIAARGPGGDDDLASAMKRAEEEGVTAPQETHHLQAQAAGRASLAAGDGTGMGNFLAKAGNAKNKVMLVWGKAFGWAEQMNRKIAFAAAYKLSRERGDADPFEFAKKTVAETQYTMNKGNNQVWARGPVGATLFTFRKFSVNYLEGLARMWGSGPEGKKAFALSLAVMFLLAGTSGFPFAEDLEDAIDFVAQRVLGKNFHSKEAKRQFFADILGNDFAEFINQGISGVPGVPIDVSGRLGMGNVVPGTGLLQKKRENASDLKEVAGAGGDFIGRLASATAAAAQGDVRRALEEAAPTALKNAAKAIQMAQFGVYMDSKGRKVVDVTMAEAILKGIGFQPSSVAQIQEATRAQQLQIDINKITEGEIADLWARGRVERKPELVEQAKARLARWNAENKHSPINIDPAQINRRVQQAMMSKAKRVERTAPKEIRKAVKEELEASSAQ